MENVDGIAESSYKKGNLLYVDTKEFGKIWMNESKVGLYT